MPRLITDFDGPIIDVSERYYRVYQYCLAEVSQSEQRVRQLTKQEFWSLKRSQVPEAQIAIRSGLSEDQSFHFSKLRRDTVHTMPYFQYDTPVPGAVEALEMLQQAGFDLVVMTMRRTRELNYALQRYDLERFFPLGRRYCLANDYVKTIDTKDKPLLMARAMRELPTTYSTWMVGDTEADIAAAQSQGLPAIGVLSGIRDHKQLEQYGPTYIASDLVAAVELVLDRCLLAV
ncbi:MAG: HAD family hydrolase [Cyanobacteria bacterium P01_A01_bin.17]